MLQKLIKEEWEALERKEKEAETKKVDAKMSKEVFVDVSIVMMFQLTLQSVLAITIIYNKQIWF